MHKPLPDIDNSFPVVYSCEPMTKKKLRRFAEMTTFPNVVQMATDYQGRWARDFFHNDNPITLELACGRGDYTVAMARLFPDRNFIGIDLKGARLWAGAKQSLDLGLKNAAFLRIPIERVADCFGPNEVSEIWITFPDPFIRRGKAKKRLTSTRFLALYQQILRPDGLIHLKTDEPGLFAFTQEVIAEIGAILVEKVDDVYATEPVGPLLSIQTTYEKRHLLDGRTIRYLRFKLP